MSTSLPTALEARGAAGARLSSPSAARNRAVIAQALAALLPRAARVLEIASGTGEHALASVEARPDLVWTPSDPDPASRASIDGWAVEAGGAIGPALDLDVTQDGWQSGLKADAVFCANMIHIAPWSAAEGLFAGASAILQPGAHLHLYGPFLEGEATAPSIWTLTPACARAIPAGACARSAMWTRWPGAADLPASAAWNCRRIIGF